MFMVMEECYACGEMKYHHKPGHPQPSRIECVCHDCREECQRLGVSAGELKKGKANDADQAQCENPQT